MLLQIDVESDVDCYHVTSHFSPSPYFYICDLWVPLCTTDERIEVSFVQSNNTLYIHEIPWVAWSGARKRRSWMHYTEDGSYHAYKSYMESFSKQSRSLKAQWNVLATMYWHGYWCTTKTYVAYLQGGFNLSYHDISYLCDPLGYH